MPYKNLKSPEAVASNKKKYTKYRKNNREKVKARARELYKLNPKKHIEKSY